MFIAIRDDDISYHTSAGRLEEVYDPILSICPVSFSCIPYVGGYDIESFSNNYWASLDEQWIPWQTKDTYPIHQNSDLVELLKKWVEQGKATIMLHGIHHHMYEFTKHVTHSRIKQALAYLAEVFGVDIKVASLPNNSLCATTSRSLADCGLNLLTSFGHYPWERYPSLGNYYSFVKLAYLALSKGKDFRYPYPLNFGKHFEQPCYGLGPSTSITDLMNGFDYSKERNGNFVIATHFYHLFDHAEMRQILIDFLGEIATCSDPAISFVTGDKLF